MDRAGEEARAERPVEHLRVVAAAQPDAPRPAADADPKTRNTRLAAIVSDTIARIVSEANATTDELESSRGEVARLEREIEDLRADSDRRLAEAARRESDLRAKLERTEAERDSAMRDAHNHKTIAATWQRRADQARELLGEAVGSTGDRP